MDVEIETLIGVVFNLSLFSCDFWPLIDEQQSEDHKYPFMMTRMNSHYFVNATVLSKKNKRALSELFQSVFALNWYL